MVRPKKYTKSRTMTTSEMVLTRRRQRLFLPRLGSRPPILPLGERGERSRGMTPAFLAPLYFDVDKRDPEGEMFRDVGEVSPPSKSAGEEEPDQVLDDGISSDALLTG